MVKTNDNYQPGLYYNLLVTITDDLGLPIPSAVSFRPTAALKGDKASQGTNWSKAQSTNPMGSVLWSIDAIENPLPPAIEVRVTASAKNADSLMGTDEKLTVYPSLNTLGLLDAMAHKSTQEWQTFIQPSGTAVQMAGFIGSALQASANELSTALVASDDSGLLAKIKDRYNAENGIQTTSQIDATASQALFNYTAPDSNAGTSVLSQLLKAVSVPAPNAETLGGLVSYFVNDVSQLFSATENLLAFASLELRDLFQWLQIDVPYNSLSSGYQLMNGLVERMVGQANVIEKTSADTLTHFLDGLEQFNRNGSDTLIKALSGVSTSKNNVLTSITPYAKGSSASFKINLGQFEFAWLYARIAEELPSLMDDAKAMAVELFKGLGLSQLNETIAELAKELDQLDPSGDLEGAITQVRTWLEAVAKDPSSEKAVSLLSSKEAMQGLLTVCNLGSGVIKDWINKGKLLPLLMQSGLNIIQSIFNAKRPIPFLAAIQPWLNPKSKVADVEFSVQELVSLLVGGTANVVTTGFTKVDAAARVMETNTLHLLFQLVLDPIKETTVGLANMLKNSAEFFVDASTFHTSQNEVSNAINWPCSKISTDWPYEDEIFEALALFLRIGGEFTTFVGHVYGTGLELYNASKELASETSTGDGSGSDGESDSTDPADEVSSEVDYAPVVEAAITNVVGSITVCFDVGVSLVESIALCIEKNQPPPSKSSTNGGETFIVFHPVLATWPGIALDATAEIYKWVMWAVATYQTLSEDTEDASGAADFEISGAIYTLANTAAAEAISKWNETEEIIETAAFILLKIGEAANDLLYNDFTPDDLKALCQKVVEEAENTAKTETVDLDMETVALVCELLQEGSELAEKASPIIDKIPKVGGAIKLVYEAACYAVYDVAATTSIGLDLYEFREKYNV